MLSGTKIAKDSCRICNNKANSDNKGTVMKKIFIIFLVLIGCIGLISCASGNHQGDILHPVLTTGVPGERPSMTSRISFWDIKAGRISIKEFNEKEIVFKIRISLPLKMWLEYVIVDEEENSISEESFYHDKRSDSGASIRKMKAKEEFIFRKGKNYTLYIGRKLPLSHTVYGHFQLLYSYKFVL